MLKVSVIIPVYNVEEYLPKCLDSVLNQTLEDIEIIVVNDGSPDNSEKIIKEYKKKDKRIVYYKKENGGLGSARNYGLSKANGEYIYYLDSDDYIDKEMLETLYNEAINKKLDVVICGYKSIYPNRVEEYIIPKDVEEDTLNNKNSKIFNLPSACCKIYKRDWLIKQNIKFVEDKLWYEDFAYNIKILSSTDKVGIVNSPLYNYLIRENSIMNNSRLMKNLDILLAFDDVILFLKEKEIYDEFYSEVEYLAIDNIIISGITRIIRATGDKKVKKEVINKYYEYMKTNFSNYKDNIYINRLSNNRKLIYRLICMNQYWLVRLIFKIKN